MFFMQKAAYKTARYSEGIKWFSPCQRVKKLQSHPSAGEKEDTKLKRRPPPRTESEPGIERQKGWE